MNQPIYDSIYETTDELIRTKTHNPYFTQIINWASLDSRKGEPVYTVYYYYENFIKYNCIIRNVVHLPRG